MAFLFGLADLTAALVDGGWQSPQDARFLVAPLALALLGIMSGLLVLPRLHKGPNGLAASRLLNGFFALFGLCCVLLAGAELVSAFADDAGPGLAVFLDVPLVVIGVLGMWCAIAGTANLVRSNPH
jgi:hypothetical protein